MRAVAKAPVPLGALLLLASLAASQSPSPPTTAPREGTSELRAALYSALEDERHAVAFYEAVLARHGDQRPFSNIVHAERRHASALIAHLERLQFPVPGDPWEGRTITLPATFAECCDAAAVAEIRNIRMYDELLATNLEAPVASLFRELRAASKERHLPAFQKHGGGWQRVADADLAPEQQAQRKQAITAQKALFAALMEQLQAELERGGPAQAVDVCKSAAPTIAAAVSREHELRIGRTSWKLRNPTNTGPPWTGLLLDDKPDAPQTIAAKDGRLGVTIPIRLAAPCLACHGQPDALAPDVRRKLQQEYPEDRATGFAEGDLRGWFWVEVPPPKP
ncbi:MAG: DUF3365 domain-containing protein [Planctomycetota bacterium]